jgi:hypothetical protein
MSEGPPHYSRRQKRRGRIRKTKITARLRKWTTPKLTASTRKRQGEDILNMIAPRIVNGARRKSIGKKFGQIREEKIININNAFPSDN